MDRRLKSVPKGSFIQASKTFVLLGAGISHLKEIIFVFANNLKTVNQIYI